MIFGSRRSVHSLRRKIIDGYKKVIDGVVKFVNWYLKPINRRYFCQGQSGSQIQAQVRAVLRHAR